MNRSKTTTRDRAALVPHEELDKLLRKVEVTIEEVNTSIQFREMTKLECRKGSYLDMILSWNGDRDLQQGIVLLQGLLAELEGVARQQIGGITRRHKKRLEAVKTKATRTLKKVGSVDVSLAYYRSVWWL